MFGVVVTFKGRIQKKEAGKTLWDKALPLFCSNMMERESKLKLENSIKTIRIGEPQPTATSNQFRIDIPPSVGQGGTNIISFASGFQLMIVDMQLEQSILFQGIIQGPSVGFGFCLKGGFHSCFDPTQANPLFGSVSFVYQARQKTLKIYNFNSFIKSKGVVVW